MSRTAKKKFLNIITLLLLSMVLVVFTSVIKYPEGDVNFTNSDATYHTLLTMQAYDETPVSVHKFLPIVTLGGETDKNIPWGATVPDSLGNYYYTSFSPAGFALPYLFCKIFFLPINEMSLYIFNSVLFFASAFLVGVLVLKIFCDKKSPLFLSIIAVFLYILTPETLISMGIVYWHQSIMQIALLVQLIAFIDIYKFKKGKCSAILFLVMCFINPYIEWTGYVANVGYALAFLAINRKDIKIGIKKAIGMAGITFLSFMAFTVHYCSTIDFKEYVYALGKRFLSRSITERYSYLQLLTGYLDSFFLVLCLVGILFIVTTLMYKGFSWIKLSTFWSNKIIFAVTLFFVAENVLMKEHSVLYTYDRMKLIFILLLVICDFIYLILAKINYKAMIPVCLAVAIVGTSNYFIHTNQRVWELDFEDDNKLFADYCMQKYTNENSVYGVNELYVRAYINLLFHKSMYEHRTYEDIIEIAQRQDKQYVVYISAEVDSDNRNQWNVHKISYITVFDCDSKTEKVITLENGAIVER